MGVPFGSLLSFLIPVFGIGVLNKGISQEEIKDRIFYYLMGQAGFCSLVTLLTLMFWIKGHSRISIMTFIAKEEETRKKGEEKEGLTDMKQTFLTDALLQNQYKGNQSLSINQNSIKTDIIYKRKNTLDKDKDFYSETKGVKQNNATPSISQGREDDNNSTSSELQRNLAAEQLKKNNTIFFHVKHILKRGTLFLLIINYGFSFGSLTAQGSLAADIYSLYGVNQVNFYLINNPTDMGCC